jgi:sulfur-oxidizing protein SoxY
MNLAMMRVLTVVVGASLAWGGSVRANEKSTPDPYKSAYWEPIKQVLFGDRDIQDGKDVIRVFVSLRADDASTVPIAVKAQIDQTEKEYIKTIFLIVERNPSPTAGVFNFSVDSGRAQVETRLRFEDMSFVRAVAEMNDGRLFQAAQWVKASGGCSAPNEKNRMPQAMIGKMKFRFEDDVSYNKPLLTQINIRHPNESSLAADFEAGKVPQFVRKVNVTFGGRKILDAEVDFSISDNPSFRFYFTPKEKGDLRIEVEDTHDQHYVQTIPIAEGVSLPGN